jgi:hypothetical protein
MVMNIQIEYYLLGNVCSQVLRSGVNVPIRLGGE